MPLLSFTRASGKFPFPGFLAALIALSFPAVLAGTRTFYFRDFGYFGYPFAFYYRRSFWNGELPLWNFYHSAGIPFLAQWNTLVLYPPSFIYLLLPLPWSLNLFCLLHLFLAGLGMARLARRFQLNPVSAAVAGTAFAFSAFTISALVWPHTIAALGWMPWVIVGALDAIPRDGRPQGVRPSPGAAMLPILSLVFWRHRSPVPTCRGQSKELGSAEIINSLP